jgi:ligand-binding sensor domain-containing protein
MRFNKTHSIILSLIWILITLTVLGCKNSPSQGEERGPQWVIYNRANTNNALLSNNINWITIDGSNKKWFATHEGASTFSSSGWSSVTTNLEYNIYSSSGTTISREVLTSYAAGGNTIWFGLNGGGIKRFSPSGSPQWIQYISPDLSTDFVFGISADNQSNLWIATSYGVTRYKPSTLDPNIGSFNVFHPLYNGSSDDFMRSVQANTSTNEVWFGSDDGILFYFDFNGQKGAYTVPPPANGSRIYCLALDISNNVWGGTDDGLFKFSRSSGWEIFIDSSTVGGLPSNHINAITIDINGNKWIGTDKGLAKMKNDVWTKFNTKNSPLPSNNVRCLAIDIKGNLWIGTDNGIAEYNPEGTL